MHKVNDSMICLHFIQSAASKLKMSEKESSRKDVLITITKQNPIPTFLSTTHSMLLFARVI